MTIAQCIVAYSVCWWLVLFMVLPQGLTMEKKPGTGHVPSAPSNPRLKRKFIITSFIAILPTLLIYFVATQAKAEDTIYHVGGSGDCAPLENYTMPDGVSTKDGYGVGDKQVLPADLNSSTILGDKDSVDIPLEIPSQKYLDPSKHNVDLTESKIQIGKIRVSKDGSVLLNDQPMLPQKTYGKDCPKK